MSAHRILRDLFLDAAPYDITDPGDTKTLIVTASWLCAFTSSPAAETRTRAQLTKLWQVVCPGDGAVGAW